MSRMGFKSEAAITIMQEQLCTAETICLDDGLRCDRKTGLQAGDAGTRCLSATLDQQRSLTSLDVTLAKRLWTCV